MFWDNVEGHPVLTLRRGPASAWWGGLKRMLDFTFSLLALVGFLPILLATALAIRLDSPGPVLFSQERVGLNKRRFKLHKFRTMVPDAEQRIAELEKLNEQVGPVFKIRNDPRVTRVGKVLRKYSLDELPQFINVLTGEMSLVGPRPLPVRDYKGFSLDWHRRRFSVRPGITCLWQVSGRNNIPFSRWMELDLEYIDNWSLWLDLKILLLTIPAVIKGRGAN
jgi:exopolysaccharide biosynthesis polyprenyl glycosylphosphotransferase